ncbi:winged helix-turn-helix domain-containing protein [Acidithiobacillus thiooxidans]|uniref:winged helix-turn-helix domain-containing protein n=1 Tax=Acidithiobacillus thiooxidans TaxID=930 RepID=UPI0018E9EF08|nr:winged helix-turn-helix domain-containing protein [Acidithiobacillus thiooxidans]
MNTPLRQINLFADIANAYAEAPGGVLDNASLYAVVAEGMGTTKEALDARIPIGRAGVPRSTIKRKIRWYQQTLKQLGILEHVPGARGVWQLSEKAGKDLHRAALASRWWPSTLTWASPFGAHIKMSSDASTNR